MRNYWSSRPFSKWIRKTFTDVEKPTALPMGEWDKWGEMYKSKNPFIYWVTEDFLDGVQNVVNWPSDKLNAIRYYIKNRFFDKMHYLPTRLQPGHYQDLDTRLLHAAFESLVDFIEIEKAWMTVVFANKEERKRYPGLYKPWYLRWKGFRCPEAGLEHLRWEMSLAEPNIDEYGTDLSSPSQAHSAKEQYELYNWWKKRLKRPDVYDFVGLTEFRSQMDQIYGEVGITQEREKWSKEHSNKLHSLYVEIHRLEEKWETEDEKMFIRLVKIRRSLWT